ncbi:MAG: homoserine dehydrogenase [Thaumarchaeota archaeon]|nr:homoserine dehydrogenase [Nitrososphaerota archaeon]
MRLALVGFGVVAQAFTKIIAERRQEILKRHGLNPRIVAVIDQGGYTVNPKGLVLERLLQDKASKSTVTEEQFKNHDLQAKISLVKEIEADVVVETTPTNLKDGQPGLSYLEKALAGKKHVITTNKGPLALSLPALMELAEYNGVELRFSGTVGGGTPILEFGKRCLVSDKLLSATGILNGTTNFILTRMEKDGMIFDEALAKAQKLGYAEADPSLDIDGFDTACKTVIIANWLFNRRVTLRDIKITGIRNVDLKQVKDANTKGRAVKLLGIVDSALKVEPKEVSRDDPLCVEDTLNAVKFQTEYAGEEIIIGRGAGGMETASAVLRDLIAIRERMAEEIMA